MNIKPTEILIPERELSRMTLINQWEKMYHSEYVYNKIIDQYGKKHDIDPLVPIPALISEVNADLLFNEFPVITFENKANQNIFDEFIEDFEDFETDMLESATYNSALGTLFWHLFLVEGKLKYQFIKSNNVIWDEDIFGITELNEIYEIDRSKDGKWIDYKVTQHYFEFDSSKRSPYLDDNRRYIIRHYEVKVKSDNYEIKKIISEEEEKTDFNFIPIIKLVNIRQLGLKSGKSDYQGKEQMFAELDNRVDQINYVLQENGEPWVILPRGVLNEKGQFNRQGGKMLEKGPGTDNTVDVITWDAGLSSAFEQIRTLINLILFTSRISPAIAGVQTDRVGGNTESGRALKWRSVNTFSMISRKRKYWNDVFRKFVKYAQEMVTDFKLGENYKMSIMWKDGLPLDRQEVVENIVKEIQNGLKSKLTALQELNDIDPDTAQKELDRIASEKQQNIDIEKSKFAIEVK